MKFTANQTDLQILGNLTRVTNKMFPNIKLEATSCDILTCSACDGSISMQAKVKCIDGQGSCLVDGKKFYELISKLDGKVSFDNGVIKSGKRKFNLAVSEDTDNMIKFEPVKSDFATVEIQEFIKQLKKTVFATSTMDTGVLNGVCVKGDEIAATNGNFLALNKLSVKSDIDAILPRGLCDEIIKCFSDYTVVKIANDRVGITFATDDFELTSRLIEGNYPKYQQLIPTSTAITVTLDKQQILDELDILSVVKNIATNACVLEFDKNSLKISASGENTGGDSELEIDYSFEPLKIAFNMEYLKAVLKNACDSDVFELGLNGSLDGVLLKPNADDVALIMPVQVR